MQFKSCKLKDVLIIQSQRHEDGRGYFSETYRKDLFVENGIQDEFVQSNESVSQKGTLRGMHFQNPPKAQAKLVEVVDGAIVDVLVDMRQDSSSFGQWESFELSAQRGEILYVPKGFAHGFLALSDRVKIMYRVSDYYSPEHESGIAWNDPELNIEWPQLDVDFILSPKDKEYGLLKDLV